jgi:hypothetical protein
MKKTNILFVSTVICAVCILSVAAQSDSTPTGITPARARSLVGAAVGLVSVIVGGLAWGRSVGYIGKGSGRAGAIVALVSGMIGIVLSVVHLAGSTGFGTGGGRAGAIVALVLSLIGAALGGFALSRSRDARSSH